MHPSLFCGAAGCALHRFKQGIYTDPIKSNYFNLAFLTDQENLAVSHRIRNQSIAHFLETISPLTICFKTVDHLGQSLNQPIDIRGGNAGIAEC
jgi:hypothetical protein